MLVEQTHCDAAVRWAMVLPPTLTGLLSATHHAPPYRTTPKQKGCFGMSHWRCLPGSHTALVSAPPLYGAEYGVDGGTGMASNEAPEERGSKNLEVSHPKVKEKLENTRAKMPLSAFPQKGQT